MLAFAAIPQPYFDFNLPGSSACRESLLLLLLLLLMTLCWPLLQCLGSTGIHFAFLQILLHTSGVVLCLHCGPALLSLKHTNPPTKLQHT